MGRNYTPHPSYPRGNIPQAEVLGARREENQGGGCNVLPVEGMAIRLLYAARTQTSLPPRLRNAAFCAIALAIWQESASWWGIIKIQRKPGQALHDQGHPPENNTSSESCIHGDQLLLGNGKTLPFIKSGSVSLVDSTARKMPVVRGRVGEKIVDTLWDTGCSGW
jgi:hypothetical protein